MPLYCSLSYVHHIGHSRGFACATATQACINAAPRSIPASLSRVDPSIVNVYVVICVLTAIHGIRVAVDLYRIMDKFLSGRKRALDDSEASTSAQTSVVPKIKSRKYSQEYLNFGFTSTEVNEEERPLCVICSKILAADSMKPNKLKRHLETLHSEYVNKPREFFELKLKSYEKQKSFFKKTL